MSVFVPIDLLSLFQMNINVGVENTDIFFVVRNWDFDLELCWRTWIVWVCVCRNWYPNSPKITEI